MDIESEPMARAMHVVGPVAFRFDQAVDFALKKAEVDHTLC